MRAFQKSKVTVNASCSLSKAKQVELQIALDNNVTIDQVHEICAHEEARVPDYYDTICARAASDGLYFKSLLVKYNLDHRNLPIQCVATERYAMLQAEVTAALQGTNILNPIASLSLTQVQEEALMENMTLNRYLKNLLAGPNSSR